MFSYKKRKPVTSTLPTEESLDGKLASLQAQFDFIEKFQNILGNSTDPMIQFQKERFKKKLEDDIRSITLSGNDLQDLVQRTGTEIKRAEILKARDTINADKGTHDGMVYDLVNDQAFQNQRAKGYDKIKDPEFNIRYREYLANDLQNDPSRQALEQYYVSKGKTPQEAFKRSTQEALQNKLANTQDSDLVQFIKSTTQLKPQVLKAERPNQSAGVQMLSSAKSDQQIENEKQIQQEVLRLQRLDQGLVPINVIAGGARGGAGARGGRGGAVIRGAARGGRGGAGARAAAPRSPAMSPARVVESDDEEEKKEEDKAAVEEEEKKESAKEERKRRQDLAAADFSDLSEDQQEYIRKLQTDPNRNLQKLLNAFIKLRRDEAEYLHLVEEDKKKPVGEQQRKAKKSRQTRMSTLRMKYGQEQTSRQAQTNADLAHDIIDYLGYDFKIPARKVPTRVSKSQYDEGILSA